MPYANALLDTLSGKALSALDPESVELAFREVMSDSDKPIEQVWFPASGVVSMVNEPHPGQIVEFATIGREGFTGLPLLLGSDRMPSRVLVQVAGRGYRVEKANFLDVLAVDDDFRGLLMRYTLALMSQIAQSTSCNRLHEVQERCARWLLMTHDRCGGDSFALTQEFLAQMLGVHRPTVTVAAGMLQKAGLIDYSRGTITVRDRDGLELAACPCYRFITREYDRLVGRSWALQRTAGATV